MKFRKRQILLLSALLVSSTCVVGNVCASYVVNDQAGILGIKVGIEEIANPTVSYYVPNSSGVFSISGDPVEVTTSTFNVASNAPSIPSDISNYKFVEWCTDANLTTAAGSSIEVTEDTILYAKYIGYFVGGSSESSSSYHQMIAGSYSARGNSYNYQYLGPISGIDAQIYAKYLSNTTSFVTSCNETADLQTKNYIGLVTSTGYYRVSLKTGSSSGSEFERYIRFQPYTEWTKYNMTKFEANTWKDSYTEFITLTQVSGSSTLWEGFIQPWLTNIQAVRSENDSRKNYTGTYTIASSYSSTEYTLRMNDQWDGSSIWFA